MSDNKSEPATKADLKELDQKIEKVYLSQVQADSKLEQKIEKVYLSQIQSHAQLEQKMDKMMDKMDKLYDNTMSSYEKTVLKGEKYDQKAMTHANILMEQGDKISNHEKRLTLLENLK